MIPDAFAEAMDDDLAIPQALAVLHDRVRAGNAALDSEDLATAAKARGEVTAMTEVLGINPLSPEWRASETSDAASEALSQLVDAMIARRETARSSRDFAGADLIRDELAAAGIQLEDTPSGPNWRHDR